MEEPFTLGVCFNSSTWLSQVDEAMTSQRIEFIRASENQYFE